MNSIKLTLISKNERRAMEDLPRVADILNTQDMTKVDRELRDCRLAKIDIQASVGSVAELYNLLKRLDELAHLFPKESPELYDDVPRRRVRRDFY